MRVGRVRTLPGWRHGAEVAEALLWGAGCGAFLACPGTFCKGGVCSVWPAHWIHRGCFKLKLDCNQKNQYTEKNGRTPASAG